MITIQILEKLAKNRLLLSWREPGRCNYTEQLWALRKVPRAVKCALTGNAIRRGERAYMPVGDAANHGSCICEAAVSLS